MAFKIPVGTREITLTTGTGDLTVSGVISGTPDIQFSATMGIGDTAFMRVVSGDGNWEEFLGTYSAANTIQRTTTIINKAGTTSHISLTGTSRVFAILPSDWQSFFDQLWGSTANSFMVRGASTWSGITAAAAAALLPAFVGDSGSGGTKGLVPAPAAGDAAAGKVLKADGTWATAGSGGSSTLAGDTDVSISSPVSGQVLAYDGTHWVNQNRSTATGWHYPVTMATTGVLPANTYNNGTSGVGATLTGNSNGALVTIDGITPVVGYRILVKDEVNGAYNGIYTVTQIGDSTHPYILTRADDFDDAGLINQGDVVVIGPNGTVNNSRFMEMVAGASPIVMGTTSFTFRSIGVSYPDFIDRGAFDNTHSYTRGNVASNLGRRFLNKLDIAPSGSTLQWDTGYAGAGNWTISGTNHENAAWTTSGFKVLLSSISSPQSGKVYFEMKVPKMTVTSAERFGLCLTSHSSSAQVGASLDGFGLECTSGSGIRWVLNGTVSSLIGLARTSVDSQCLAFAVDFGAKKAWVQNVDTASGWYGTAAGDPVAGTNGFDISTLSAGSVCPAVSDNFDGTAAVPTYLNTGQDAFLGTIPSGYSAFYLTELGVISAPAADTNHWIDIGVDGSAGIPGIISYSDFIDQGAWSSSSAYAAGAISTFSSKRYLCKSPVAAPSPTPGWNATYAGANWTINGTGNKTATWVSNTSSYSILANQNKSSGKIYFEIQPPNEGVYGDTNLRMGMANSGHVQTTFLGASSDAFALNSATATSWFCNGSSTSSGMGRVTSGNWLGFAIDLDNKKAWVRDATGAPSTWYGNGGASPDPATGTNGFDFSAIASTNLFPAANIAAGEGSGSFNINIGEATLASAAPSGFTSLYASISNPDPSADTTHWIELGAS